MSRFNSCYRYLQKWIDRSDVSHAWMELHRCVEAYSRTTGIPFTNVFEELEETFRFKREIRHQWPKLEQMKQAGDQLNASRDAFLLKMNQLIAERKLEKKIGKRSITNPELIDISYKQTKNEKRCVGFYGWRLVRNPVMYHIETTVVQLEKRNAQGEMDVFVPKSAFQIASPFLADGYLGENWSSKYDSFFKAPLAILTLTSPRWNSLNQEVVFGAIHPEHANQRLVRVNKNRFFLMRTTQIEKLMIEISKK